MSRRNTLILGTAIVLGYLALLLATHEWGLGRRPDGTARYPYLLEDHYDRSAYEQRGRWIASGGRPYVDEMAEYPQLSVLLMALPYLTFEHGVPRGEPFGAQQRLRAFLRQGGLPPARVGPLVERSGTIWRSAENAADLGPDPQLAAGLAAAKPEWDAAELERRIDDYWHAVRDRRDELLRNREAYGDRHQVLMAIFYVALLALAAANLAFLGHSPAWALLLCLPASLFYGFNRYDMVVTALVAGALWFQLRGRPLGAAVTLGFAIMAKWFPIVFLPLFLAQNLRRSRAAARERGERWAAPREIARQVLLPGLATALVCTGFLAWSYFYKAGGWAAVRALPDWHAEVRQPNHASLLWILTHPDDWAWFALDSRATLEQVFKVLQLAPAFVIALVPWRSNRALILGALVATLCMMLFSEFFSPQWVIWVTALSLLLAPRWKRFLVLCVALELVCYTQLPVLYFEAQASSGGRFGLYYESPVFDAFHTITNTRVILMFVFLATAVGSLVSATRGEGHPTAPDAGPLHQPGSPAG